MFLLLLLSLNAFAIEHLPCQRALHGSTFELPSGERVVLEPDQILIKGKLHAFWETGMEDQTGWSVIDDHINKTLSGNGYDALFILNKGDRVFILNADGSVKAEGLHDEIQIPGVVNIFGRDIEVYPNRPFLVSSTDPNHEVIAREKYKGAFEKELSVVVVSRMDPNQMQDRNARIEPKLKQLPIHLADPTRFVPVGSGEVYERKLFEKAMTGKLTFTAENVMQLMTEDGPVEIRYGDRIYCVNAEDRQLGLFEMNHYPATVPESPEREALTGLAKAVIIRRMY